MEFGKLVDWQKTDGQVLLLVDEMKHRIVVQQPDGRTVAHGGKGTAAGEFHYPRGILALGSSAYVVDSWNHRVQVFDIPTWNFKFEFGRFGAGPGEFFCPGSISFADPWLMIADTNNSRISFHDRDGRFSFSSGIAGESFPRKVQVAAGGFVVQYETGKWDRLEFV